MNANLRVHPLACCFSMVLVAVCFLPTLGAQPATPTAAKPKVTMAPRPLPGMGSSSSRNAAPSPETPPDIDAAEAQARAKVPLFRPATVTGPASATTQVEAPPSSAAQRMSQSQPSSDRARIIVIRRRGTFQMPKEPAREAPVIVQDLSDRSAPVEAVPVALPPGKIRVIPRDSVNVRTSLPPSQP